MALIDIQWNPTDRQLRQFAAVALVFFLLVSVLLRLKSGASWPVTAAVGLAGLIIGVAGLARPRLVLPVYRIGILIAFPIGTLLSHVLLVLIYYVVFTPIGWVTRLVGYDPMNRKPDPAAATYWVETSPPEEVNRYFHQY